MANANQAGADRLDHADRAARAEYEAGADLKSVVGARPQSAWAWSALGAAALADGDAVSAYSHALVGRALGLKALEDGGWVEGQPVGDAVLLALMVTALAAESLGIVEPAERARALIAAQGHDPGDRRLLAALAR
jgi:hypothetical protein